jgi:hypothetical protein
MNNTGAATRISRPVVYMNEPYDGYDRAYRRIAIYLWLLLLFAAGLAALTMIAALTMM